MSERFPQTGEPNGAVEIEQRGLPKASMIAIPATVVRSRFLQHNEQCAVCGHTDQHHAIEAEPWPPKVCDCESCPGGVCRLPEEEP